MSEFDSTASLTGEHVEQIDHSVGAAADEHRIILTPDHLLNLAYVSTQLTDQLMVHRGVDLDEIVRQNGNEMSALAQFYMADAACFKLMCQP